MVGQILGCLLALLLILLLIPLRLECICRDGVWRIRLFVLVRWLLLYPAQEDAEAEAMDDETDTAKQKTKKEKSKSEPVPIMDMLALVDDLLPVAGRMLGRCLRGITVRRLRLSFAVTGEDAAEVGIRYGQTQSLCYTIYSELAALVRLREWRVTPRAHFTDQEPPKLQAELRLGVAPIVVLVALLCFVARGGVILLRSPYFKIKTKKDGAKNGTDTHR